MKKVDYKELIIWILAVIPLVVTAVLYPTLPEKIPMHWNIHGEIDSWGGRSSALFMPLLIIGMSLLLKFIPKIDPRRRNYERFGGAYYALRLMLVLFMGVIAGFTLYAAYDPDGVKINTLIPACVGLLLTVIGNYMPKFKQNYFAGIRTPWTLANEEVWSRTHRFGGTLMFYGGLALTVLAFILPSEVYFMVMIPAVMAFALAPTVYSYFVFRRVEKQDVEKQDN